MLVYRGERSAGCCRAERQHGLPGLGLENLDKAIARQYKAVIGEEVARAEKMVRARWIVWC